jgi:hypothetical protein
MRYLIMSLKSRPPGSNCEDPENRSKKNCCCGGGYSICARKKRKRFTRESLKCIIQNNKNLTAEELKEEHEQQLEEDLANYWSPEYH